MPLSVASAGSFDAARRRLRAVDGEARRAAAAQHDALAKPLGSLGDLERLGARLAAIARVCPPPVMARPAAVLFAGDHGVVAEGVTPWPSAVTASMVRTIASGRSASAVLARQSGASLLTVDVGVSSPLAELVGLRHARVAAGTANLATTAAMTAAQCAAALDVGAALAGELVAAGADGLVCGEMGIGNTTPAAALIAALTGRSGVEVTGRGTGIDDERLRLKQRIVAEAAARQPVDRGPLDVLADCGGLEIAALTGFVVGGAAAGVPVVLDGVITLAAALVAVRVAPDVLDYCIAGHRPVEPGGRAVLEVLGLDPVLDLALRLGEGTGALLALPVLRSAAALLGEMATLAEVLGPGPD